KADGAENSGKQAARSSREHSVSVLQIWLVLGASGREGEAETENEAGLRCLFARRTLQSQLPYAACVHQTSRVDRPTIGGDLPRDGLRGIKPHLFAALLRFDGRPDRIRCRFSRQRGAVFLVIFRS